VVPEIHDELLGLADIECKAVVLAPLCQLGYLISVLCFLVSDPSSTASCSPEAGWQNERHDGTLVIVENTVYIVLRYCIPGGSSSGGKSGSGNSKVRSTGSA